MGDTRGEELQSRVPSDVDVRQRRAQREGVGTKVDAAIERAAVEIRADRERKGTPAQQTEERWHRMDVCGVEERQVGIRPAANESQLVDRVCQGPSEVHAAHLDGDGRGGSGLEDAS